MDAHEKLILHLSQVLELAKANQFHDFKNDRFPAPKMALVDYLQNLIDNTKNGVYDN